MSTQDFKIVNGVSLGFLCSMSLLTISSIMNTNKGNQSPIFLTDQWQYFKQRAYRSLLVGFPLGFLVGYKQKPLLNLFISNLG